MTKDHYPIPQKGYVLIVNINKFHRKEFSERVGSELDVNRLAGFFRDLGNYIIVPQPQKDTCTTKDLCGENGILQTFISRVANDDEADFCFIAIMSHGDSNSCIYTSDSQIDFEGDVLRVVHNGLKETKQHIPKIFVVNACRGPVDLEKDEHDGPLTNSAQHKYSAYLNTLLFYGTLEGFKSKRTAKGSHMLQILCNKLNKYHDKNHLEDIFTKVIGEVVSNQKQVPEKKCLGFGKSLFLTEQKKNQRAKLQPITSTVKSMLNVTNVATTKPKLLPSTKIIVANENNEPMQVDDSIQHDLSSKLRFSQVKHGDFIGYQKSIPCRVLWKHLNPYKKNKTSSHIFLLVDEDGCEMKAIAYGPKGKIIFDKLSVGHCVEIKKGQFQRKKRGYEMSVTRGNLELKLENIKDINILKGDVPTIAKWPQMDIKSIKIVEEIPHGSEAELLVLITSNETQKKIDNGSKRRNSTIKDEFNDQIVCSFWGSRPLIKQNTLVYIRNVGIKRQAKDNESNDFTDYYNVAEHVVVIEIKDESQLPPSLQPSYAQFKSSNGKGRKRKSQN